MRLVSRIALTLNAGYCDASTFIAMDGVFSAHVTGNFVLFAAAMAEGLSSEDYIKLWTFPVFLLGVSLAVLCAGRHSTPDAALRRILMATFSIFMLIQIIHYSAASEFFGFRIEILLTLLLVLAMAMQNTIHRYVSGPMTTVMTGTVMHTAAQWTQKLLKRPVNKKQTADSPSLVLIISFALGCVFGGFAVVHWQWWCLLVPFVITGTVCLLEHRSKSTLIEQTKPN